MSAFEFWQNRHLAGVLGPTLFLAVTGCNPYYETDYCLFIPEEDECETDPDAALKAINEELSVEACTKDYEDVVELDHREEVPNSDPEFPEAKCCYTVVARKSRGISWCGRALVADQGAAMASLGVDRGWNGGGVASPPRPRIAGSTPHPNPPPQGGREGDGVAAMWARAALAEHASVAAFARAAFELMAHGAPADLVDRHLVAARDEVRHAEAAFRLAGRYSGEPVGPGPLPNTTRGVPDLGALAAEVAREGCVGETLAACLAAAQRVGASDPEVIATLEAVIRDESAHAALAWETLAWLIGEGGEPVRAAAAEALATALSQEPDLGLFAVENESAETVAHGGLSEATLGMAARRVLAEVVGPMAKALLGEGGSALWA